MFYWRIFSLFCISISWPCFDCCFFYSRLRLVPGLCSCILLVDVLNLLYARLRLVPGLCSFILLVDVLNLLYARFRLVHSFVFSYLIGWPFSPGWGWGSGQRAAGLLQVLWLQPRLEDEMQLLEQPQQKQLAAANQEQHQLRQLLSRNSCSHWAAEQLQLFAATAACLSRTYSLSCYKTLFN